MPDTTELPEVFHGRQGREGPSRTEGGSAAVTAEWYRRNPFRLLGLPVWAGAREVARRMDELKLAAELDAGAPAWSFAPEAVPDSATLRAAAQVLKEPGERLVQEWFWFWPEQYPEASEGDEALGHLARGETPRAFERWQEAAARGEPVALHNLAVYRHLHALELEQEDAPEEDACVALWFEALRHWERAGAAEELWARLRARVAAMGDARVTSGHVERLRAGLPGMLAGLCAALAARHGEAGRAERAALHAALVTHIHGDMGGAHRVLEASAAPVARRIEARVAEMRRRLPQDGGGALDEVLALLRHCEGDLHQIGLLCGRPSDFLEGISHAVADAALDGLVAHQRVTRDDRACLPVLVHLLELEAAPELRARIAETFRAVRANVLAALLAAEGGADAETLSVEERHAAERACALRLIADVLAPGIERLGLGEASRAACAARVASLLRELAVEACMKHDDFALAMRAFDAAEALPVGGTLRDSLASDRAQLQRDFELRREKELRVEGEGHVLLIDRHGIALDGQRLAPEDVAAIRHGVELAADPAEPARCTVGWKTRDGREFALGPANLLPPSPYVQEHYGRIVDSVYFFLVPPLIGRIVAAVRGGASVTVGDMELRPEGVVFAARGLFRARAETVPFARVQTVVEDGQLIVSSKENPRLAQTHDVALSWNAAIFRYVVEALIPE